MAFAFEKLRVYQKSVALADRICDLTSHFPQGDRHLADQLNRAAVSVAAHIAEGNGRFSVPDRRRFFGIARGSLQECVPLLELAARRGLLARPDHQLFTSEVEDIARMLSGLIGGNSLPRS